MRVWHNREAAAAAPTASPTQAPANAYLLYLDGEGGMEVANKLSSSALAPTSSAAAMLDTRGPDDDDDDSPGVPLRQHLPFSSWGEMLPSYMTEDDRGTR